MKVKGFHLGRFLFTVLTVLLIVGIAARIPATRKLVFNTQA